MKQQHDVYKPDQAVAQQQLPNVPTHTCASDQPSHHNNRDSRKRSQAVHLLTSVCAVHSLQGVGCCAPALCCSYRANPRRIYNLRPNPQARKLTCVVCPEPHAPQPKRSKTYSLMSMVPKEQDPPASPVLTASYSELSQDCAFLLDKPDLTTLDEVLSPPSAVFATENLLESAKANHRAYYEGDEEERKVAAARVADTFYDVMDYPLREMELMGVIKIMATYPYLRALLLDAVPALALVVPVQDICEGYKPEEWDYKGWTNKYGEFTFFPGEPHRNPWANTTSQGLYWTFRPLVKALNRCWGFNTTPEGRPCSGIYDWCPGKGAFWLTWERSPAPEPETPPAAAIKVEPEAPDTPDEVEPQATVAVKVEPEEATATPATPATPVVITGPAAAPANAMEVEPIVKEPTTPKALTTFNKPTVTTAFVWTCLPLQVCSYPASGTATGTFLPIKVTA